jgi:hypothetical protein
MERNVVSLETAKKLKLAGFVQNTHLWHFERIGDNEAVIDTAEQYGHWGMKSPQTTYAAPTAQELADVLPLGIKITKSIDSDDVTGFIAWRPPTYGDAPVGTPQPKRIGFPGTTLAEALAALWLQLQADNSEGDVE